MIALKFATEQACIDAESKISSNKGLPLPPRGSITVTQKWAEPTKIYNQTFWWIEKPEAEFMTDVIGHTEEEYNPEWGEPLE